MKAKVTFLLLLLVTFLACRGMAEKNLLTLETLCLRQLFKTYNKNKIMELADLAANCDIAPKFIAYLLAKYTNSEADGRCLLDGYKNLPFAAFNDTQIQAKIITALIMRPDLSKNVKLGFLESLEKDIKESKIIGNSADLKFCIIAFFKKFMAEENIINIEGPLVKRYLFVPNGSGMPFFVLSATNGWLTNIKKSDLIYESPLLTDAILCRCLLLIPVLHSLDVNFELKDAIEDNGIVSYSTKESKIIIDPSTMTALDHAIGTLDCEVIAVILKCCTKNTLKADPKKLLITILNNFNRNWLDKQALDVMALLNSTKLLDLDATMDELLGDFCYRKILTNLINWLFKHQTPVSAKALEAAFINEYQENVLQARLPAIIADLIGAGKKYPSVNQLPKSYPKQLLAACAIIADDATYLGSLSREELIIPIRSINTHFYLSHLAAFYGNDECFKILLAKDNSILLQQDNEGNTPFHIACENGHINLIKIFLLLDAQNINVGIGVLNKSQYTPYDSAIFHEHLELIACLRAYNAPTKYFTEEAGIHLGDEGDEESDEESGSEEETRGTNNASCKQAGSPRVSDFHCPESE